MKEFSISQLLDNQSRIAAKAFKCQALGLVDSVDVRTELGTDSFTVKVAVNEYCADGHSWEAEKKSYGTDKEPHFDEENMTILENLLDQTIADARTKAENIITLLNS